MMKKLLILSCLLFWTFYGVKAQDKSGEIVEFKVITGEVLNLEELRNTNQSPSDRDQPGFVTISLKFEEGKKKGETVWENYMTHAGKEEFFEHVRKIINTWEFSENALANGTIYYTIATNGTILVNLKALNLPNYQFYKFSTSDFLVKVAGFEKQNIRAVMQKSQMYGVAQTNFLQKLGYFYAGVFVLLLLVLIVSIILTWSSINSNLEPKEKGFVNTISKLWINNTLSLSLTRETEGGEKITILRSVNEDNPDLDEEISFLKQLSQSLKDGTVKEKDEGAVPAGFLPPVDYEALADKINNIVTNSKTVDDKKEAIIKVKSVIWRDYSVLFIQKAKDMCLDNSTFRISRIFLAGLENHINNKDEWYTSSEIDRAVDKTAASELEQMKGWIDGLWVVGSVAPMVGLFGTVTGISSAFGEISQTSAGMEQAELITKLAGGINTALWTTIVGLAIGISATLIYYFFKVRLDSKSTKWEELFVDITNNF